MTPDKKRGVFQLLWRILVGLPSVALSLWFSLVLRYKGEDWTLTDPVSGRLTGAGNFWTVFVCASAVALLVVGIVFTWKKEKRGLTTEKAQALSYALLLDDMRNICVNKYRSLVNYVRARRGGEAFPEILTSPKEQIVRITDELKEFIKEMAQLGPRDFDNITASIAYRIWELAPDRWDWVDGSYAEIGSDLELLSRNKTTTFYEVSHDGRGRRFRYYNSKTEAERKKCYFMDERDEGREGSIICSYINCKPDDHNKPLIEAVLSISIYGSQIVADNNAQSVAQVRSNLRDVVFPEYEKRLSHELLLFYMEKINESLKAREMLVF